MAALTLAGTLAATSARAAYEPDDAGWEGGKAFVDLARRELGSDRVRPIRALDYSVLRPGDALLYLYPRDEIQFHALAEFLSAGGRAAVVDDHGAGAAVLRRFHIHRVLAPPDPALRLNDNAELPIALPAPPEDGAGDTNDHRTLLGVDQVVTNHPTALRLEPGIELTPLLAIPTRGGEAALLAVTGVIGNAAECGLTGSGRLIEGRCGRLLAMGDPSVLINQMLRYPGNQAFARGLVQYLVDDDAWGSRSGNLYVLTGHFRQVGGADAASSVLGSLEEAREALSGWMAGFRDTGLPEPVSIALAALLVLGVVSWAALSGGQRLSRVSPAYARATPLAAQGGYAGRFAVLALPSTDRGLLLLELKRSLEEDLRQRLELPPAASGRDLIEPVRRSGLLGEAGLSALEQVFRQLAASEVAVMSARRLSIPDRALSRLQAQIERIFDELARSKGTTT